MPFAQSAPRKTAPAIVLAALALFSVWTVPSQSLAEGTTTHALAMHGSPKYGPDFTHFDYVNPNAPKGGMVRYAAIGTFDTLNPFTLKGLPAVGLGDMYETLLVSSSDEAFTEYGKLAESITMPEDRSWVRFALRPEAKWHDGTPITPEDVVWTFDTLKSKGNPFYAAYYADVVKAEKTSPHAVTYRFREGVHNPELPLIVGQLPVLPKHYWADKEFDSTTLEPPLGSGPYKISDVDPGRSITFERVADYWGADLPVNKGQYNVDVVRYDYYRDSTVALEAFKSGAYDFRQENTAKIWATGYDFPALNEGKVVKTEIAHNLPTGMQGFVFNMRKPMFQDVKVRRALAYAFDFEWANENLFYGQYARTHSYFSNSELASSGEPEGRELEILEQFRGQVDDSVFGPAYQAPTTTGKGGLRANLKKAVDLLAEAGWRIGKDRKLRHENGGEPMSFEMLLVNPAFERISLPFQKNLDRLGIDMSVRTVDSAQYSARLDDFDFDMTVVSIGQSLSPGNEQRDFWSSESADIKGSRNLMGLKDPVVDELVNMIITAPDRVELIARTRALDRVLLSKHLVVPHWHSRSFRVAYWNIFGRPEITPPYSLALDSWWVDADKAAALRDMLKN